MRKLFLSMLIGLGALSVYANDVYDYLSQDVPKNNTYTPYYHQRASLFATLPVDSNDIVMLGNSLTDNARWNEIFDNPNIKNRGIIGDIIQGIYDRVDFITKGHPRKIFIMSGVNDVSHHLTPDSIARAMDKLITKIKTDSPETEIYLQSWLPINNEFKRYKNMIGKEMIMLQGNVLFEQVARRHGIQYINLFPAFADSTCTLPRYMTNDGLHVNDAGYKIWRDEIAQYIAPGQQLPEQLYTIDSNDIVLLGNNLIGYAEWHELLDNPNVTYRYTWPDVIDGLPALAKQVAADKPAKILLLSSYNRDENAPQGVNVTVNFDADVIVEKITEAVNAIRELSPETEIILQSITPVNSTYEKYAPFAGSAKKVKDANKKLRKLAKKLNLTWVDAYDVFADENGDLKAEFTINGFHLMGKGYQAWAELLKPIINK